MLGGLGKNYKEQGISLHSLSDRNNPEDLVAELLSITSEHIEK
jgi:hypothetical protein